MKKYTEKIVRNTKDPKILTEILRKGNGDKISWIAAQNPNCPPEILVEVLKRRKSNSVSMYSGYVSMYAAKNSNCPPEMLIKILKKGQNDNVSIYAANNPNCPKEMLVEILRRGKNDSVSFNAAFYNPNCPLEEKIKWMQVTGRIGKEDPVKHIIEYENNKKDDFQDLKDLL